MTDECEGREKAVEYLHEALAVETVDEKNFYIREALQLLTLTRSGSSTSNSTILDE